MYKKKDLTPNTPLNDVTNNASILVMPFKHRRRTNAVTPMYYRNVLIEIWLRED